MLLTPCSVVFSCRDLAGGGLLRSSLPQALWWEGMGACAKIGTKKFGLVASINQRVSQWAEPLFMRKAHEVPHGSWLEESDEATTTTTSTSHTDSRSNDSTASGSETSPTHGHSVPPFGPSDYVIDAVWSTSSLRLPPLPGANGSLVSAAKPGSSPASIVQSMDKELIVVHFRNATADGENNTNHCKSGATVQGQDCMSYDSILWILSTALSHTKAAAPVRQLHIQLRPDVWSSHPIEPDAYQGERLSCGRGNGLTGFASTETERSQYHGCILSPL